MKQTTIYTTAQRASLSDLLSKAKAQGNKAKERANKVSKDDLIVSLICFTVLILINGFILYAAFSNIGTTKHIIDMLRGNDQHIYINSLGASYNNYPGLIALHLLSFMIVLLSYASIQSKD